MQQKQKVSVWNLLWNKIENIIIDSILSTLTFYVNSELIKSVVSKKHKKTERKTIKTVCTEL